MPIARPHDKPYIQYTDLNLFFVYISSIANYRDHHSEIKKLKIKEIVDRHITHEFYVSDIILFPLQTLKKKIIKLFIYMYKYNIYLFIFYKFILQLNVAIRMRLHIN